MFLLSEVPLYQVCMEAGIIGIDGKRRLEALGFTLGHEPVSEKEHEREREIDRER